MIIITYKKYSLYLFDISIILMYYFSIYSVNAANISENHSSLNDQSISNNEEHPFFTNLSQYYDQCTQEDNFKELDFIYIPKLEENMNQITINSLSNIIASLKNISVNSKICHDQISSLDLLKVERFTVPYFNSFYITFDTKPVEKISSNITNLSLFQKTIGDHFLFKNNNYLNECMDFIEAYLETIDLSVETPVYTTEILLEYLSKKIQEYNYFKSKYIQSSNQFNQTFCEDNVKIQLCNNIIFIAKRCNIFYLEYAQMKNMINLHLENIKIIQNFSEYISSTNEFLIKKHLKSMQDYDKLKSTYNITDNEAKNKLNENEIMEQKEIIKKLQNLYNIQIVEKTKIQEEIEQTKLLTVQNTKEYQLQFNKLVNTQIEIGNMKYKPSTDEEVKNAKLIIKEAYQTFSEANVNKIQSETKLNQNYQRLSDFNKLEKNTIIQQIYEEEEYLKYIQKEISFFILYRNILVKNFFLELDNIDNRISQIKTSLEEKMQYSVKYFYEFVQNIQNEELILKSLIQEDIQLISKIQSKDFPLNIPQFEDFLKCQKKLKQTGFENICDILILDSNLFKTLINVEKIYDTVHNEFKLKAQNLGLINYMYNDEDEGINNLILASESFLECLTVKKSCLLTLFFKNMATLTYNRTLLRKLQKETELLRIKNTIKYHKIQNETISLTNTNLSAKLNVLLVNDSQCLSIINSQIKKLNEGLVLLSKQHIKKFKEHYDNKDKANTILQAFENPGDERHNLLLKLQKNYVECSQLIEIIESKKTEYAQIQSGILTKFNVLSNISETIQNIWNELTKKTQIYNEIIESHDETINIDEVKNIIDYLKNQISTNCILLVNHMDDLINDKTMFMIFQDIQSLVTKLFNIEDHIRHMEKEFQKEPRDQKCKPFDFYFVDTPGEPTVLTQELLFDTTSNYTKFLFYTHSLFKDRLLILEFINIMEFTSQFQQNLQNNLEDEPENMIILNGEDYNNAQKCHNLSVQYIIELEKLYLINKTSMQKSYENFKNTQKLFEKHLSDLYEDTIKVDKKQDDISDLKDGIRAKRKLQLYHFFIICGVLLLMVTLVLLFILLKKSYNAKK
ncbi:hypothetical protein NUSPORA_01256 [Nucleospora cyclopteri]